MNNYDRLKTIAYNLKEDDKNEIWASHGMWPLDVITNSIAQSSEWYMFDDECVYGLVKNGLWDACPWLLTTNKLSTKNLLRYTKQVCDVWNQDRVLYNYVDARHKKALRWAEWAGFEINPPVKYGYLQLPFHLIIRKK